MTHLRKKEKMNSLCITGASPKALAITHDILHSAGMQLVKTPKSNEDFTLAHWHEQVVSHYNEKDVHKSIKQLGRFWEQIVCNIFMENYRESLWGWADTRSAWLLDFWYSFDPQLKFIFVYTPPEHLLADFITHASNEISEQDFKNSLSAWQRYYETLLGFYEKYPSQCLLINITDYKASPSFLIEQCEKQWQLSLDYKEQLFKEVANQTETQDSIDPLAHYFATEYLQDATDIKALQHRIESLTEQAQKNTALVTLDHAFSHYNRLTKRIAKQEQQQVEHKKRLGDENSQLKQRVNQYQTELDALKDSQLKLQEKFESVNNENKTSKEENELLLLQLHQVQEELERSFLKLKDYEKQTKELNEAKVQQDKSHQQQKLELEKAKKANQAHNEQLKKLKSENTKLSKENAEKIKETEEENELLLLQLHQVQEELEHYFLKYQDSQKTEQDLQSRWQRMLSRNPDYCDYASLTLNDTKIDNKQQTLIWQLSDLHVAGRSFAKLNFKTIIDKNIISLSFEKSSGNNQSTLLRWPVACRDKQECILHPSQANHVLAELSYSDWLLLKQLYKLLINEVKQNSQTLNFSENIDQKSLMYGLSHSLNLLNNHPAILRFDTLKLKREQVNKNYEHLWFTLSNINFAQQHWESFEFRLSCANVSPEKFATHPKLEFPETTKAVLDSWFNESNDDFGNKLELRFAAPDAIDIGVWNKLSTHDHTFMMALVQRLPNLLQQSSENISRQWQDWQQLVKLILKTFDVHQAALFPNKKEEIIV